MDGAGMPVHVGQGSVSLFNDFGELLVPASMHAEVFPGQAPVISTTVPVFMSADKPILQDNEEQQRETNQSPTSASRYASTDVMRTLDPDIIDQLKMMIKMMVQSTLIQSIQIQSIQIQSIQTLKLMMVDLLLR